jgi:hypothetical protein
MITASQKAMAKIAAPASNGWAAIHASVSSIQVESIGAV